MQPPISQSAYIKVKNVIIPLEVYQVNASGERWGASKDGRHFSSKFYTFFDSLQDVPRDRKTKIAFTSSNP